MPPPALAAQDATQPRVSVGAPLPTLVRRPPPFVLCVCQACAWPVALMGYFD
eukprot:COSAG01_NODE_1208_length_11239_cov_36.000987_17_plen_52_part_00